MPYTLPGIGTELKKYLWVELVYTIIQLLSQQKFIDLLLCDMDYANSWR